jgi:O-antigen/teichoic acid export membrane protein
VKGSVLDLQRRVVDPYLFQPQGPGTLGFLRLFFFSYLFWLYVGVDHSGWADLSSLFWTTWSEFDLLGIPPLAKPLLRIVDLTWKASLVAAAIGLWTRHSMTVSLLLGTYLMGMPHNFSKIGHYQGLLLLAMLVLTLSHCGDAWSIDAWRKRKQGHKFEPSGEYTWPIRLVWLAFAIAFFAAGWAKLIGDGSVFTARGWTWDHAWFFAKEGWLFNDNLKYQFMLHHYLDDRDLPALGLYIAQSSGLCMFLAVSTIIVEMLAPAALFSRVARCTLIPSLFLMQLGNAMLLGVHQSFPWLPIYMFWIPWGPWGQWIRDANLLRRQAANNLFWLTSLTILGQLCALGGVFLMTEAMGKATFGLVVTALFMQRYFLRVGCAGVKPIIVREIAKNPDQLDMLATSHFVITLVSSSLVAILTTVVVWLAPVTTDERLLITLLAWGNIAACTNLRPLFDAQHQQPKGAWVTFFSELVALGALMVMCAYGQITFVGVGLVFAGKWLFTTLGQAALYHWTTRRFHWNFSGANIRFLLNSSWPIMLTLIVSSIPLTFGVVIVRYFKGEEFAADIGLAQQLTTAFVTIVGLCGRVIDPHIAGQYGLRKTFIKKLAVFASVMWLTLYAIALGGTYIVFTYIIRQEFSGALLPAALMLLGALLVDIARMGGSYLVVLRRERRVFHANLLTAITFLATVFAFMQIHPVIGTSVATVLATSVGAVFIGLSLYAEYRNRCSIGTPDWSLGESSE